MNLSHGHYARQSGFTEAGARQLFKSVTDVKTLLISCLDPRASDVPAAVAREFGESWPGEIVRDEHGNKVAFTTNIGVLTAAGGRAIDTLRSLTVLSYLLGVEKIVIVHHTFCGMTAFTADGVIAAHRHDHGTDISGIYDPGSLEIADLEQSIRYDVALVRKAPAVPKTLDIYGYVYDIDAETLIKIVEDRGTQPATGQATV